MESASSLRHQDWKCSKGRKWETIWWLWESTNSGYYGNRKKKQQSSLRQGRTMGGFLKRQCFKSWPWCHVERLKVSKPMSRQYRYPSERWCKASAVTYLNRTYLRGWGAGFITLVLIGLYAVIGMDSLGWHQIIGLLSWEIAWITMFVMRWKDKKWALLSSVKIVHFSYTKCEVPWGYTEWDPNRWLIIFAGVPENYFV